MAMDPASLGKNRTITILTIIAAIGMVFVFLFFRLRVSDAPSRLSPELQQKQQEIAEDELQSKIEEEKATQTDRSGAGGGAAAIPETPEQKRERQIQELNQLFMQAGNTLATASVGTEGAPETKKLTEEEANQIRKQQLTDLDALMLEAQKR